MYKHQVTTTLTIQSVTITTAYQRCSCSSWSGWYGHGARRRSSVWRWDGMSTSWRRCWLQWWTCSSRMQAKNSSKRRIKIWIHTESCSTRCPQQAPALYQNLLSPSVQATSNHHQLTSFYNSQFNTSNSNCWTLHYCSYCTCGITTTVHYATSSWWTVVGRISSWTMFWLRRKRSRFTSRMRISRSCYVARWKFVFTTRRVAGSWQSLLSLLSCARRWSCSVATRKSQCRCYEQSCTRNENWRKRRGRISAFRHSTKLVTTLYYEST